MGTSIFSRLGESARHLLGRDKPQLGEMGATGTALFGGVLSDTEYLPDLQGERGAQAYERMRSSDGQVKGSLLACELPYHSAYWDIQPGTSDAQGRYIADYVRDNLFEGMTSTWDNTLHHILLMLVFGFSPAEKVFELEGGYYRWRKWAPRMPRTISKWKLDPEGGLLGVTQRAWRINPDGYNGTYQESEIPVEKLLIFTYEKEGSNFTGRSLLRAAYKHWWYKNTLYAIDGIAAERHGVGLPTFTYPRGASDDEKNAIKRIGERLHAHERAYVSLPDGLGFDLKGVSGQLHDIKGSIEHHDVQIARSILAQFLNLGTGAGSYALSEDQSGFFLMALKALGNNICDTINRYAIRQLVDYNWEVQRYPKLTVSDLDSFNVTGIADAVTKLVTAGLILPDNYIEAELRRRMHLPAMRNPGAERPRPVPQLAPVPGTSGPVAPATPPQPAPRYTSTYKGFEPRRPLSELEQCVKFADIAGQLDGAEERLVKALAPVQRKQVDKLVEMVAANVRKDDIERIATIDVPYRKEAADAIFNELKDLYQYGQQQITDERQAQRGGKVKAAEAPVPAPDPWAFLRLRATSIAGLLANKLRSALAWEALRQLRGGAVDTDAIRNTLQGISDNEIRATARLSASEAFNLGRQEEAKKHEKEVVNITSSALLDDNTCPVCAKRDGVSWKPGEAGIPEAPPYADCEGRDRCRCVWIYTFAGED